MKIRILILGLVLGVLAVLAAKVVFAALPFGGQIHTRIQCANGALLTIGLPTPGPYLLPFGARIFAWFAPFPGRWILGNATPGGACTCPKGNCKAPPIGARGTIFMVGTSP